MSVAYNPLSGNFETKEPGPQGPTGTVSAAGDGSQGAPSISFASESNTGLYKYASESIAISTAGTGRLFIDSNGRVGIGTTPGNTLHLAGPSGVGTRVQNTTNSLNVYQTFEGTEFRNNISGAGAYTWYTGGGEKFRVDNNGRVGIGATVPSTALHINSTNNFTIATTNQTNAANSYISFVDTGTTAGQVRCGSQGNDFVVNAGGARGMTITASGTGEFADGNVQLKSGSGYSSVEIKNTAQRYSLGTDGVTNNLRLYNNTSSTTFSSWQTNGDFYHGGGSSNGTDISSPNIRLNADGSASFSDTLDAKGLWSRRNLGTDEAIKVTTEGGNTNVLILGDGSAEFAGGAAQFRNTGELQINRTAGANTLIGFYLNGVNKGFVKADGSASFAGGQTAITSSGVIDIQSTTAAADASTLFRCGSTNTTAGANAFVVKANGSAEFAAGAATIDSNGRYEATSGNSSVTVGESGFISLERDAANENAYLFRGAHKMGGSTIDSRFVVWGDGSTGIGGTLNATSFAGSSPNITLKADGSAELAGKLKLTSERLDVNYRSGNSSTRNLIQIFEGTSSDDAVNPSVAITNEGSAKFAGSVSIGGTDAAHTMDEYEEGTWEPAFIGTSSAGTPTYGTNGQAGKYIKVGNKVTAWAFIHVTALGGAAGNINITGLPYPIDNTGFGASGISVGHADGTLGNSVRAYHNTTFLELRNNNSVVTAATGQIYVSISYTN